MRRLLLLGLLIAQGCVVATILGRNVSALVARPKAASQRPCPTPARLRVTWVGHATVLLQLDDRAVLTDPALIDTVGAGFSKRLVAPGLTADELPRIDAAIVSHLHLDHLSLGSLGAVEQKLDQLLLPMDGLTYLPEFTFPIDEVAQWTQFERNGLRVTALPVRHPGARYGLDGAWMTRSAASWLVEYQGLVVSFAGDTAFDEAMFIEIGRRVGRIDLALLPIGPVEPQAFARPTHLDGEQAIQAARALKATHVVPIHFDTFAHGVDPPGLATERFLTAVHDSGVPEANVHVLAPGECWAFEPD